MERCALTNLHAYYDQLDTTERAFVDGIVCRTTFRNGRELLGYDLLGDDACERAVDALARWVLESRKENHRD